MSVQEPFTLYYFTFSGCSLAVRFSIAASPPNPDISFVEKEISLYKGEQIQESYLDINPKGQVPTLTHPTLLKAPLPESVDITYFLNDYYPNLVPAQHATQLKELMDELHKIGVFTLSMHRNPGILTGMIAGIKGAIGAPGISEKYKKQLEYKLQITENGTKGVFEPATVAAEEEKTRVFVSKVAAVHKANGSGKWIFGTEHPTALDTHSVVIMSRLRDVGRDDLISEMKDYLDTAQEGSLWKNFMQGKKTVGGPPPS